MTGIERLRELAELRVVENRESVTLRAELRSIADQIDREQDEQARCQLDDYLRVRAVERDMERHLLGHEGMEDSPVARWARELREALGGDKHDPAKDVSMSAYDLLPQEEREAIAWVREHGGLSHVKDIYHDFRAVVERLGIEWSESELHGLMDALDRRLMPEGMEWPRFENGEPVRIGDEVDRGDGDAAGVDKVVFYGDQWRLYDRYGCEINEDMMEPGERVKRPAPEDSWERLEEDAGKNPFDYCKDVGHRLDTCENSEAYKARDIVRRAKALAERDR